MNANLASDELARDWGQMIIMGGSCLSAALI